VLETRTCALCHTVRGTDASGRVGPDLTHLASRATLAAGTLPNTSDHLAHWITDPQATKPGNLMPPTPLAPADLQALVAYLESLT
jgi:cytochrome c oxidase subunit 2